MKQQLMTMSRIAAVLMLALALAGAIGIAGLQAAAASGLTNPARNMSALFDDKDDPDDLDDNDIDDVDDVNDDHDDISDTDDVDDVNDDHDDINDTDDVDDLNDDSDDMNDVDDVDDDSDDINDTDDVDDLNDDDDDSDDQPNTVVTDPTKGTTVTFEHRQLLIDFEGDGTVDLVIQYPHWSTSGR